MTLFKLVVVVVVVTCLMTTENNQEIDMAESLATNLCAEKSNEELVQDIHESGVNQPGEIEGDGEQSSSQLALEKCAGECFRCGQDGHKSRECPQRSREGVGKEGGVCYICDQQGHKSFRCPKKGECSGKGKRKRSFKEIEGKENSGGNQEEKVSKRVSPNVFLGFQVSNPVIHKSMLHTQDELVTYDEKLKSALVPVAKSHITLLVASVKEKELEHAIEVTKKGVEQIKTHLGGKVVKVGFDGIGSFENRVVFANPVSGLEEIKFMRDTFFNLFKQENVLVTDTRFNAHLTIAKIRGRTKIPKESYTSSQDLHFGSQQIQSIQLLSMTKQGNEKGYYFIEAEFLLDNTNEVIEDKDHTQCCAKEALEREERKAKMEKEKTIKSKKIKFKDETEENKETRKENEDNLNFNSLWALVIAGVGIACSYFYFSKNRMK